MSFRIKRGERVDDAVGRIVDRQLRAARREAKAASLPLGERVHAIRSRIKKARAALRLVRRAGGRALVAEEHALRDLARSLADARDNAVTRATLGHLAKKAGSHAPPAPAAERTAAERDLRRALERLEALRRRTVRVPHGGRAARGAFTRGYREARRLMHDLRPDESGPRFHEWRKVVKRLALQARLLRRATPALKATFDGPLERLPQVLGQIHDLYVLHTRLEGHDGVTVAAGDLGPVLARLREEAHDKRVEALALGARIFARRPRDVRARLDAGWRAWRH
jgi:CHAD domain-containing protein